ncbi:MAG: hypothetical protein AB8B99_09955 [Phormidesmis sp.]
MIRLSLLTLSAFATFSVASFAQAEERVEPTNATETNGIILPDSNSPINVVNPGARSASEVDATVPEGPTDEATMVTPATEVNTILSPDDSSPVNVVNPGAASSEDADYSIEPAEEADDAAAVPATEQNTIISPNDNSPSNLAKGASQFCNEYNYL